MMNSAATNRFVLALVVGVFGGVRGTGYSSRSFQGYPAILRPCDSTEWGQSWELLGGWGHPNDLVQTIDNKSANCLDVADRSTADGAAIRGWQCCCEGHQFPCDNNCGDNKANANQAYDIDSASGTVLTAKTMGSKCLVPLQTRSVTGSAAVEGAHIVTQSCAGAGSANNPRIVYVAASIPHLRLSSNLSLCLEISKTAPPAPPPGPPSDPYVPVPQACTFENTTSLPFCDPSLSVETRVSDLVQRMTPSEKMSQFICGIGGGVTPGIPRLGVPPYQYHSEGLHGLRTTCGLGRNGDTLYSTMFPQVTAMAATGNLTLIHAMASHMGDEARAVNNYMKGNTVGKGGGLNYWGPTMNIGRDPRWGRFQESVSEDPWLNGAYAAAFVRGFQGSGDGVSYVKTAACCKHFFAYSLENSDGYTRHNFNANVSAQDMMETYGPPFAMCVAAQPEQIMCSYNAVNGTPTCLDDTWQNGWLRGALGWNGVIFSDCDAVGDAYTSHHFVKNGVEATAYGIRGGCDMNCGKTYSSANLAAGVAQGLLNVSAIDVALRRVMAMRMRLGMFDNATRVPYTTIGTDVLNNAVGQQLALEAARSSIVLLQNTRELLPLSTSSVKTIAVVGPLATDTAVFMGGKNDYCPQSVVSVCAGLQARAQASSLAIQVKCSSTDVGVAEGADVVVAAFGGVFGHEASDRKNISLPQAQATMLDTLIAKVTAERLALVLLNGDPVALDAYKPVVPTIVEALEGGQAGGTALAEMLFGDFSPSGTLPFTIYPDAYVAQVAMSEMRMRADPATNTPGHTYRFYDQPLWPFGYGLTYTTWAYAWSKTPAATQPAAALRSGALAFTVTLHNTGSVASARTVQLYVRAPETLDAPRRWLGAMDKVYVAAGQRVDVQLTVGTRGDGACSFCLVGTDGVARVSPGTVYAVSIGDGQNDYLTPFNLTAH
eukprot:m.29340 g.29340  ORF g.29340 m.29340 type:complete len:940 (+) comp13702_c0_seq1:79-2898(+)